MKGFKHRSTAKILQIFEELSHIPRCSNQEESIRQWLLNWAGEHSLEAKHDAIGNVLMRVPASQGYETSKPVVIQGHLDMVCEKLPASSHDFSKDPIELVFDGEWLTANGTTLGADNGIGVAIGLALVTDQKVKHPSLELLYTVGEEVGLIGANNLSPDFVEGRILLNLDSEEEGIFTIGAAGGQNSHLFLPLKYETLSRNYRPYTLFAGKMRGGHSGADIHTQRANAIHVLCRVLNAALQEDDCRISYISGGTVSNAIPRDAEAIILFTVEQRDRYAEFLSQQEAILKTEFKNTDPELTLRLEPYHGEHDSQAMTRACTQKAVDFLSAIPHGVACMSTDIDGLVETSSNLAKVTVEEGKLKVLTSQRSSAWSRLQAHTNRIEAIARLAGAEPQSLEGYPPWEPNWDSPLVEVCQKVYQKLFKTAPKVKVIHAGLECGVLGDTFPGMDMVSFAPTIRDLHSPEERLEINSIGKVWDFLTALLKKLK